MTIFKCLFCGKEGQSYDKDRKFCNQDCYSQYRHHYWPYEEHPRYGGGPFSFICPQCGNEFVRKSKVTHKNQEHRFCSLECRNLSYKTNNIYKERTGPNNPNWKTGKTANNKLARNCAEYKDWKNAVFKRDDYTCQRCLQRGGTLHAHHLLSFSDYPELRYVVSNGQTLCLECHSKRHGRVFA